MAQPTRDCLGCGREIPLALSRCSDCRIRKAAIPDYRTFRARRSAVLAGRRVCWICGKPGTVEDPLEVDHVLARARGGTHDPRNLRPAHLTCNRSKGAGRPRRSGLRIM